MFVFGLNNYSTRQQDLALFTQKPLPAAVTPDPALPLAGLAVSQVLADERLFIVTADANKLYILEPTSRAILAVHDLPFRPAVLIESALHELGILNAAETQALGVDTLSLGAPYSIPAFGTGSNLVMAPLATYNDLVVSGGGTVPSGNVRVNNLTTGEETDIYVGGTISSIHAGRRRAFVFDHAAGNLAVIGLTQQKVTDRVSVGATVQDPIFTGDDVFVVTDGQVKPLFINDVALNSAVAQREPESIFEELQRQNTRINRVRLQTSDLAQLYQPMTVTRRDVDGSIVSRIEFPGLRLSAHATQKIIDFPTSLRLDLATEVGMGLTSNSLSNMMLF